MLIEFVLRAMACFENLHAQAPGDAPEALKPPPEEKLLIWAHASGAQVCRCDGSAWTLTGPDAKLFDQAGRQIGTHFPGPAWKALDGSSLTAKPAANATVDSQSIPWLLLTAVDHSGSGAMENLKSIERRYTAVGKAPASVCDAAHKDQTTRSLYIADYYFYGAAK